MSHNDHLQLVEILDISIDIQKLLSSTSGNVPITPTTIVAICLCLCGGENIKLVADIFGMGILLVQ